MRRNWTIVILVFFFMLVNYADKSVLGLSSVSIMRELHLTRTQFGTLGSAFFLLFSISGIGVGFLATRVRTTKIMAVMAALWAVMMLWVSVVPGFAVLVASRIVLGAAEGPAFPIAMHSVYQWFDERARALPSSVVASGTAVGAGLLAPLITWIIVRSGWRTAFAWLGVSGLVWLCAWFVLGREGPVEREPLHPSNPHARSYAQLLLSRTAIGVYVAGFAAYTLIALNLVWLANYLTAVLHLSPQQASFCIALPSALQIVLAPGIAAVSQGLSSRGVTGHLARGLPGAACVMVGGLCVMCLPLVASVALKIAFIGLGFSIASVIFTLGSALLGEIAPADQRSALLGTANAIHTTAGLLTPFIMGRLVDVQASPEVGFRVGFLCVGCFVVITGLVSAFLMNPAADRLVLSRARGVFS